MGCCDTTISATLALYVVLAAFRLFVLIHLQVDVDDRKVGENIEEE